MKTTREKPDHKRPFSVFGKFQSTTGNIELERWVGKARTMPKAVRQAVRDFWKRKPVRRRHHALVVLSCEPLSLHEYQRLSKRKRVVRITGGGK